MSVAPAAEPTGNTEEAPVETPPQETETQAPDTQETPAADEPQESAEKSGAEEPEDKHDSTDEMKALADRLAALEEKQKTLISEKEAAEKELAAAKDTALRNDVLDKAGIPREYALFLSGDAESMEKQADMLVALKGSASPAKSLPRDPAIGETPDSGVDNIAAEFFKSIGKN